MEMNFVEFRRPKLPKKGGIISSFALKTKEALFKSWVQYLGKTKVSGMWYLQDSRIYGAPRYIYVFIMIVLFVFGLYLSFALWMKFYSSPTIVTISQGSPTTEIDFPAITVCSGEAVLRHKLSSFVDNIAIPGKYKKDDILDIMRAINAFTYRRKMQNFTEFSIIQEVLDFNNLTHGEAMSKVSMNCNDILRNCYWSQKEFPCFQSDKYLTFKNSTSYMGHCCSFNYNPNNQEYVPFGINSFGYNTALEIVGNFDFFGLSTMFNGKTTGLFLSVHHPNDFLGPSAPMVTIRPNVETHVVIYPTELSSSKETLSLSTKKRNCLVGTDTNEMRYRRQTCFLHCKIENIIHLCGCIPYHLFLGEGDQGIKSCEMIDAECYLRNYGNFLSYKCEHCLPSCFDITYDLSTFSITLTENNATTSRMYSNEDLQFVVRIYYGSRDVFSNRKIVIMSWTNLLANIGGAINLCLGLSIVSCVEIIYFFTIRLYKNYHKQ